MVAGVQHVHAPQAGDVEQHPSSRDALAHGQHVVGQGALPVRDQRRRLAAVHLPVPEDVGQRVEVGDVEAVEHQADELLGAAGSSRSHDVPATFIGQAQPGGEHVSLVLDG